jgi:hypothetical protein
MGSVHSLIMISTSLTPHRYTHYWSLGDWDSPKWQEAWPLLVDDVPKIIRAANVDLSGPTDDPDVMTPVLVDIEKGIHLNGVEYDSYESFIISKKDTGEFNFCKTARRPYDIVVTCILLRAWMLAPDDFRPRRVSSPFKCT